MDKFSRMRASDKLNNQTAELIGIARGILADGEVKDAEIEYLHKWLVASKAGSLNPVLSTILQQVEDIKSDGIIDDNERADLLSALNALTGSDFELGELLKSTTLPLCAPVPEIVFSGAWFCFTGTFTFGRRKACESAVIERNGKAGGLSKSTRFLVIGEYATDSWANSSYGRKIEKAVELRNEGTGIHIVSEALWREAIENSTARSDL